VGKPLMVQPAQRNSWSDLETAVEKDVVMVYENIESMFKKPTKDDTNPDEYLIFLSIFLFLFIFSPRIFTSFLLFVVMI
jgi:hypothetical protein